MTCELHGVNPLMIVQAARTLIATEERLVTNSMYHTVCKPLRGTSGSHFKDKIIFQCWQCVQQATSLAQF